MRNTARCGLDRADPGLYWSAAPPLRHSQHGPGSAARLVKRQRQRVFGVLQSTSSAGLPAVAPQASTAALPNHPRVMSDQLPPTTGSTFPPVPAKPKGRSYGRSTSMLAPRLNPEKPQQVNPNAIRSRAVLACPAEVVRDIQRPFFQVSRHLHGDLPICYGLQPQRHVFLLAHQQLQAKAGGRSWLSSGPAEVVADAVGLSAAWPNAGRSSRSPNR